MNTSTILLTKSHSTATHRYQVYRQSKNGLHSSHGPLISTPDNAVALFLATPPAFDGGEVRLWNHHNQCLVASVSWRIDTTRMGFTVLSRVNVFHDPFLNTVAERPAERERAEESMASQM